jgi:lipopolysaccharide transport protein LptA
LFCGVGLTFIFLLLNNAIDANEQETASPQQEAMSDDTNSDEDVINVKHADRFEHRDKEGLTIFTGNVQIERTDGFLNADKVTIYEDVQTNETVKTVAEGNVELRDGDTFATCAHAILNHVTDIIELRDNVVVLQNEDRLEADAFTYNRRTGERSGEGNIKVRFRVKQKKESESDQQEGEESESSVDTSNP